MTRTERTYYLVHALYSVSWSFIGPMYALYLLSRGLDLFQINAVLATFLIVSFVFEVPTGAIADRFGRKISFLLSCVVRIGAYTLYAFSDTFAQFLLAEAIDAIGMTLASGALDAWAVDGMHAEGDRRSTDRFFARAHMISRGVMIATGVVSGYIAQRDLTFPWFVAAASFALTAIVGLTLMRSDRPDRRANGDALAPAHRSLTHMMHEGLVSVRHEPTLRLLCLLTLTTSFAVMPAMMMWQPRMEALSGEGVWAMGWIWAFINLAEVVGSAVIRRLLGLMSRAHLLAAAALWRGATLAVAAAATGFYPALTGFLLYEMAFGLSEPLLQAWMNEHTAPEQRATVLSVRSMAHTLGGSAGLICLGLLARGQGIPAAWLVAAAIIALTAFAFRRMGRLPAIATPDRPVEMAAVGT